MTREAIARAAADYSGLGINAQAVTLGTDLPSVSRGLHVSIGGIAIFKFAGGSSATLTVVAGTYLPYAVTKVTTSGGSDPTLVAIF